MHLKLDLIFGRVLHGFCKDGANQIEGNLRIEQMSEVTEKITEKQEIAILGLIAGKSKVECAKLAGCAETTIYQWLKDENFRRALKGAKDTVFESETARLYGLAAMAIESFERGLSGKAKAVEVRTAIAVFGQIGRLRENDLLERIERLERFLESKSK